VKHSECTSVDFAGEVCPVVGDDEHVEHVAGDVCGLVNELTLVVTLQYIIQSIVE